MLEIDRLTVRYRGKPALQELSLTLPPGEILGLIGPNGAGKSTLIRAISGLVAPQHGRMNWEGRDLSTCSASERARLVGVVPQAQPLGGAFSVRQTVLLGRTPHMGWLGRPSLRDEAAVQRAMQQTQLLELAERKNAELSGGEQQRVLLARALAQETPLLLLDEPTNHLDLQHQFGFLDLVLRLVQERRLAVLLALHDLNLVGQYADRILLLHRGQALAAGPASDVLTPENILTAYQVAVRQYPHPETGTPLLLPSRNQ
jgi:iron complex transport system ATP-binding protein